jgi:hypothetical protein
MPQQLDGQFHYYDESSLKGAGDRNRLFKVKAKGRAATKRLDGPIGRQ